MKDYVPRLLIIFTATAVGASLGKVTDFNLLYSSIGGGVVAAVAVGIAAMFKTEITEVEKTTPSSRLLGMRIGVVGYSVAMCGWLVGVFMSHRGGYYIVASGILIGFIGVGTHLFNMFSRR